MNAASHASAPAEKKQVLVMDSILQGKEIDTFLRLSGFDSAPATDSRSAIALMRSNVVHMLIVRTSHSDFAALIAAARGAGARILLTRYNQDPDIAVEGVRIEPLTMGTQWESRLLSLFPKQH